MTRHKRNRVSSRANELIADYRNLRTIPAVLGMVFFMSTLYQFGAFQSELSFAWFDYTLTTEHAVFASLMIYAVAFASSETRQFEHYEDWEKILITLGPVLVIATEYSTLANEWIMTTSDPWSQITGAAIVLIGYGVAIQ